MLVGLQTGKNTLEINLVFPQKLGDNNIFKFNVSVILGRRAVAHGWNSEDK